MLLSEHEKRDIIQYLEAGKPLPEKYRFLLFDDKREIELVWNGKTSEVTNTVLPFQVIEQIDEPRGEDKINMSATLFDDSGRQIHGWTNKLIWGDNKLILSSLKNGPMRKEIEAQGGLKLIYIDPPFDVGADFSIDIKVGEGIDEETLTKKPSVIEEVAYRDTWGKGVDSFNAMIYERLQIMADLLSDNGSIYVHCDYRVSSYMKLILDEIFGVANLKNEIIWYYKNGGGHARSWFNRKHDTVYWYSRNSEDYIYNGKEAGDERNTDEGTFGGYFKTDEDGRRFQEVRAGGKVYKYYTDELKNADDVWDFGIISQRDKTERVDFPTQKPESLLERIIKASSNEGDLIADFFAGSGTTLAVAEKLNRKWIGSDLGKFSIHTTRKRMIDVQRSMKKEGKDFRAFEILNIGRYERESFISVNDDLRAEERVKQAERKEKEFVQLILNAFGGELVESFSNIVGKKRDRLIAIGPINYPVSAELIESIFAECIEKNITKVDVLGFDYEMGVDFSEYGEKGVDIAFKVIPREVFDKKAVERGHVKFYDVAFIEVKPIVKGTAKNRELTIELTDFSVFYSQDSDDGALEKLKPGSSKVIVENGQVVKVSKNKQSGDVSKEILTKKWSDWIDYWAIDFDFQSRKEIVLVEEAGEEKEVWTGDYIFDNEWQSFRTKKNRELELASAIRQITKGKRKVAVKVVDIFGNDTTKVIDVEG